MQTSTSKGMQSLSAASCVICDADGVSGRDTDMLGLLV